MRGDMRLGRAAVVLAMAIALFSLLVLSSTSALAYTDPIIVTPEEMSSSLGDGSIIRTIIDQNGMPFSDVVVRVDGSMVITSGADSSFSVNVSAGPHFITVSKYYYDHRQQTISVAPVDTYILGEATIHDTVYNPNVIPSPSWHTLAFVLVGVIAVIAILAMGVQTRKWFTVKGNSPPSIIKLITTTGPVLIGNQADVIATFENPDIRDTHTAVWEWGDGTTSQGIVDECINIITGSHAYEAPGKYLVSLTVTDSDGASAMGAALTLVYIYDPARTEAFGDFDYHLVNSGTDVEITGYHGDGGVVTIPGLIDGRSVVSIGGRAFSNCSSITSIIIPDSVVNIGDDAFEFCLSLTTLYLGSGVTHIGANWLYHCTALTAINVVSGNENYASVDGVLYSDNFTHVVVCPEAKSGSIRVPRSVKSIGDFALANCSSITAIHFESNAPSCGNGWNVGHHAASVVYYYEGATGYTNPWQGVMTKALSPFERQLINGDTEVEIIGYHGDGGAVGIPSEIDGKPVKSIGSSAFYGKTITSVTIPEGVTTIRDRAFKNCRALTSVTIPASVTDIEYAAFAHCGVLKEVHFEGHAPVLGDSFVNRNDAALTLYYYEGATGFSSEWNGVPSVVVPAPSPVLKFESPVEGSFIKSPVTVRWVASDHISRIAYCTVKLDGRRRIKVTVSSHTFTKLKNGLHSVTVQAFNNAGLSTVLSSSFIVDSTAPSLEITSPRNGATVHSNSVAIQWAASDSQSGIAYCMVKLDSGTWIKVDASNYTFSELSNGKHTVKVQAIDNAGNAKEATVKFTVKE
jgi:hypothetical protein